MKLLFDENLSPHLVHQLADVFPESAHVHQLELGVESDQRIWSAAAELGYTLVTKDSDYYDLSRDSRRASQNSVDPPGQLLHNRHRNDVAGQHPRHPRSGLDQQHRARVALT